MNLRSFPQLSGDNLAANDTRTDYSYTWWDSAQVASNVFDENTGSGSNALWTSTYSYG